jgi:hypothetical protein
MKLTSRIWIGLKAISELGIPQVGQYGLYQLGKRSSYYTGRLDSALKRLNTLEDDAYYKFQPCLQLPDPGVLIDLLENQISILYEQADEIVNGQVRLFGSQPVALELVPPGDLKSWVEYEGGNNLVDGRDIKFIWEPGRFGWACTLARAYYLSGDEKYAQAFWEHTEQFLTSNPPYFGPHWSSAQEVAIRLTALTFAFQIFSYSKQTIQKRAEILTRSIAIHAERIPTTMRYARSQNNNHLIIEALGLYTASAFLPGHPLAHSWHRLGWKWLQYAFLTQIDKDGTYTQHSTNYHRLMLHAALWAFTVHNRAYMSEPFTPEIMARLAAATIWLWKLVDPETGQVPNLGHNDGSCFLPLAVCPFNDYRPVLHAAVRAFLYTTLEPKGPWAELGYWLGVFPGPPQPPENIDAWRVPGAQAELANKSPYILVNPSHGSWAAFKVTRFNSRPAHADQLHVDLWWHGQNLAIDPGTYLYNAPPPWENSLTCAFVHNSVTIDGKEYLFRAGRFLYLDRSQSRIIGGQTAVESGCFSISAQHNGYRHLGITHNRTLTTLSDGRWAIDDLLKGVSRRSHTIRLHWLLPDWEHELLEPENDQDAPWYGLRIRSPYGWVSLKLGVTSPPGQISPANGIKFMLARAGELQHGPGNINEITGWTSPTYGEKIPALACILEVVQPLPVEIRSEWSFPHEA